MEKMRALSPEDLEKVIGGASEPNIPNQYDYKEFCDAWNVLGLSATDPTGSKRDAAYKKWVNSKSMDSAYDYLLQFSS